VKKGLLMLIYGDTSVFGGVFDDEFSEASRAFFDEVRSGRFEVLVSSVVLDELRNAPEEVRRFYRELDAGVKGVELTEEAVLLVRQYIAAGIVGEKWRPDAQHVAMATVSGCRAIVSWNFRHIVHFEKIPLYNGVNLSRGFNPLAIHTPQEVLHYEDKDEKEI
jgi:predicted nucleic acid-binding protein